jgi:hypothetical protein
MTAMPPPLANGHDEHAPALYNTEAEQALLGSLLIDNSRFGQVAGFLSAEHFGNAMHGRIYAAIGKLLERGQIANPVTLKNLFDQDGALTEIGGAQYLARLAGAAATIINAEDYGRAVHDLYLRRELITLGKDVVNDALRQDLNDPAREQIERAGKRLDEISRGAPGRPTFFDPWAEPAPPDWPNGVFPAWLEDMLFAMSARDGVDVGAQGMTLLSAASGAAPKNARFLPYGEGSGWWVPPIIWVVVIAVSGQRKTALLDNAFSALQSKHAKAWEDHSGRLRAWRALSPKERREVNKPEEPHCFIIEDATPEKVQAILAGTVRGSALIRDELAGFLGFGRYGETGGAAERGFYLQSYEAKPYTVSRMGRDTTFIRVNALTVYGNIQPDRLAEFKGLEKDGMLQRFATILAGEVKTSEPGIKVPGKPKFDVTIATLAALEGTLYRPGDDAQEIVRQMESDGRKYAALSDYGIGFQGFCDKLHGTHARLALILHLIDNPVLAVIPARTVERAARLIRRFILPQARDFYAAIPGAPVRHTRDIAGWLITRAPTRIRVSDVAAYVKACRGLNGAEINAALDPLVTGGWLEPETPFPSNRAWTLHSEVRSFFASRAIEEARRRADIRRMWQDIAAGQHGPS